MNGIPRPAPEWQVEQWFNTPRPLDLRALRGKVILLGAFQMLCPGCVAQFIPQLLDVRRTFDERDVGVIGLHTVFEHHAAMTPVSLEAFIKEYRIPFPVGVDRADPQGRPQPMTMRAYAMQGTPTTVLIDRHGRLLHQTFGHIPDVRLGAEIAKAVSGSGSGNGSVTEPASQGHGPSCHVQ